MMMMIIIIWKTVPARRPFTRWRGGTNKISEGSNDCNACEMPLSCEGLVLVLMILITVNNLNLWALIHVHTSIHAYVIILFTQHKVIQPCSKTWTHLAGRKNAGMCCHGCLGRPRPTHAREKPANRCWNKSLQRAAPRVGKKWVVTILSFFKYFVKERRKCIFRELSQSSLVKTEKMKITIFTHILGLWTG